MNVDKITQDITRELCKQLFDEDFLRKTTRIKSATLKEQIDEVNKRAPSEIKERLRCVKLWIEGTELLIDGDATRRDCLEYGLAAGIAFSVACMELGKARPEKPTRRENPVWKYVRLIASENPGLKVEAICEAAIVALKKDRPKAKKPKREYLVKHYAEKASKISHV